MEIRLGLVKQLFLNNDSKNYIKVGMGEIAFGRSGDILKISAMGSCVALVLYVENKNREQRYAVMGHIMYSSSEDHFTLENDIIGNKKYADIAVPIMIKNLEKVGHNRKNFLAKMSGSCYLDINKASNLNFHPNTVDYIKKILKKEQIKLVGSHISENKGRSVFFNVLNYRFIVISSNEDPFVF